MLILRNGNTPFRESLGNNLKRSGNDLVAEKEKSNLVPWEGRDQLLPSKLILLPILFGYPRARKSAPSRFLAKTLKGVSVLSNAGNRRAQVR